MTKGQIGTKQCPVCGKRAYPENWLPPEGIDPTLRRFRCCKCRAKFYWQIPNPEMLKHIDTQLVGR